MAQAAVNTLSKLIFTHFTHSAAEQPLLTAHLTRSRETQTPALQRTARFEDSSHVLGPGRAALFLLFSASVFSSQAPRLPSPFLGCHGHWGAQSWALHGESRVLLHSLGHSKEKGKAEDQVSQHCASGWVHNAHKGTQQSCGTALGVPGSAAGAPEGGAEAPPPGPGCSMAPWAGGQRLVTFCIVWERLGGFFMKFKTPFPSHSIYPLHICSFLSWDMNNAKGSAQEPGSTASTPKI